VNDVYTLCLARRTTPYSEWLPVCIKVVEHDGPHQTWPAMHHTPGTGETWL
jgi:hypothetical protein